MIAEDVCRYGIGEIMSIPAQPTHGSVSIEHKALFHAIKHIGFIISAFFKGHIGKELMLCFGKWIEKVDLLRIVVETRSLQNHGYAGKSWVVHQNLKSSFPDFT